ncbi:ABC transporter-like protein [Paenibacillus sp. FSL R7-269]|uniref:ABC transporter ATP-binding protein n=1 Tax=Paenibacillus sp. FSL R7-269 TaxID=1226755 RepID=UPI0003E21BBD|nr:ABC transporter ATP-binding protein [Paenibacillus sp. FSL R7-269]ETT41466.1 ABC transporter-like protein [Paenibacillus sp. FSL R7-269]
MYIGIALLQAVSWVLQVLFMQRFLDAAAAYATDRIDFKMILFSLGTLALMYLFYHVMDGLGNCYEEIYGLSVGKHLNLMIFRRVDSLQVSEFENTGRLDYIHKAVNGSGKLIWIGTTLLDILFYYTTYFVFIGWYLFTLKPVLALSIVVVFVPVMLSQWVLMSAFKNLEAASAPIRRENEYYEQCLTDKVYLSETRLLGATAFFENLYTSALQRLNAIVLRTQVRKHLVQLILNIVTVMGYGLIVYMLFVSVMRQEISIGAFAAVLASIGSLYRFMNKLITERIAWATENIGSTENFLDFIDEPVQRTHNLPRPADSDIELKAVRFRYPLATRNAVEEIDLIIPNKQTLAIVGENGSGKTTLCRIIMGLYPPTAGEVWYGNVEASRISYERTSAVFQHYRKYNETIRENVRISQYSKPADVAVVSVCVEAGVLLSGEGVKEGLDTMLGREFGGTDLSGGQWQRVAIARGLFRDSDCMILDEPTAAIDPLEETRLYNGFAALCRDKTAILVSHRLGSVKLADRILVMKDGRIVQDGTHEKLMSTAGEYRTMYEAQRKWYV